VQQQCYKLLALAAAGKCVCVGGGYGVEGLRVSVKAGLQQQCGLLARPAAAAPAAAAAAPAAVAGCNWLLAAGTTDA
jgi:hypothetical protein